MAHPNEDLVRQGYAAFGTGNFDALRSQVFHIRDGKAIEVWTHPADLNASDEFWS